MDKDAHFESKQAVQRLKRGDRAFWDRFVAHFTPSLHAFLSSRYRLQPSEVEDALQETWLKVRDQLKKDRFRTDSRMFPFLAVIAKNSALGYRARESRRAEKDEQVEAASTWHSHMPAEPADPAWADVLVQLYHGLEANEPGSFMELLEHCLFSKADLGRIRALGDKAVRSREEKLFRAARQCLHASGVWADTLGWAPLRDPALQQAQPGEGRGCHDDGML